MPVLEADVTFTEKLRILRDASGLSEREIAEKAGIPYGTLHAYMIGKREPLLSNLGRLCKAFGVTLDHFADVDEITGATRPAPRKRGNK